ncbi:ABC transporter ATP-binding protein [Paracoccus aminophilus]|uniref:ABC cobalamin/Fe3+-siderophore transporter, ATPase subunit n=1 Tax=Paracoccus aminophilus JCM 7686 TaxID=1367847 RepID=S5Z221_PARAH|nr:ABC transporter ATP-binding protein [Paracoccus aminophilus]AGT11461.1 ABC cobalamin/Fe3+-siderophore transporter, ATPase subunit [Paracoccus aminophilus JCM 7686]
MSVLSLKKLSLRRAGRGVLAGIDLDLAPGEFVGLLGANGAGKTTLLRAALGLLAHEGRSSLTGLRPAERARRAAFMPQGREIAWPVSVARLVALGRAPHGDAGDRNRGEHPAVSRALAALGLEPLRHRPATALSGGEQARVLIARMLAQDTPLLIADEPIAGLDPAAQIRVMSCFAALAAEGRTVLASLHDLGLAARHCSRLILLHEGRILADGPPLDVLSPTHLARAFGITAYRAQTAEGPVLQPLDILTGDLP